jgi:feruloyl esterase
MRGSASLKFENTTIASAQLVVAGGFAAPDGTPDFPGYRSAPAFCRVAADIKPSKDSDIKVEVWMPAAGWNGKFQAQGNGGFAGSIDYHGLAATVSRGYASAATDTGHKGDSTDASWAPGHPEKIVDFGYRGIHETAEKAKAVIAAFYGKAPSTRIFQLLRWRPGSIDGSAPLSR